jgi:AcrR family transcriptional regulator
VDDRERETRERLIDSATRLFAERGFAKVTVREICKAARANVAAVNYHFGGKTGLYQEIVQSAIRTMHGTTQEIQKAGEGQSPEEQLRIFVRVFLTRVVQARDGWIHRFMAHELNDPTPALDMVIKQVIKPRMAYLGGVIASLLDCRANDPRVEHCVMSVQAQCLVLLNDKIAARFQPFQMTPKRLEQVAEHISTFSLAGIKSLK